MDFDKNSQPHTLIQLDSGKYAFGIFVEFQKAFDTVDHAVLIQKLIFYGVHGKTNNWSSSYLKNGTQFAAINGFNSDLKMGFLVTSSRNSGK